MHRWLIPIGLKLVVKVSMCSMVTRWQTSFARLSDLDHVWIQTVMNLVTSLFGDTKLEYQKLRRSKGVTDEHLKVHKHIIWLRDKISFSSIIADELMDGNGTNLSRYPFVTRKMKILDINYKLPQPVKGYLNQKA